MDENSINTEVEGLDKIDEVNSNALNSEDYDNEESYNGSSAGSPKNYSSEQVNIGPAR